MKIRILVIWLLCHLVYCEEVTEGFQTIKLDRKPLKMVMVTYCEDLQVLELLDENSFNGTSIKGNRNPACTYSIPQYVTKLKSNIRLMCFSHRNHSWSSTAPNWRTKKKHMEKNVNYRKYLDKFNKTAMKELDTYPFVSSWLLPPFKIRHV